MTDAVRFLASGDTALTVEFGDRVDRALSARVMALHGAITAERIAGVIETVPTFRSLLVHYEPLELAEAALRERITALLGHEASGETAGELVRLPVCYGGEHGPDLHAVAAAKGLTADEVVVAHSGMRHHVYMIGFAPGHPYMGDLPEALTLPRRATPRTRLPAGTVAIAVGQTVIYPFESPGGWHAIGRTPVPLFDLGREPPALLRAGDRVEFEPVTPEAFDEIAAQAAHGDFAVERSPVR